ncbi:hypothetical protein ACH4MG_27275 [Streptomyces sp. NPDC017454]|uniref:hypothetical protein n=1 Tax=Streptomyces sp. NPDC017454 TaxID=3364997 RepID=UPI0037AFEEFE
MSYSIENADRLRWQMRAHIILAQFLDAATQQGLPAIAWTIATTGAITGTVNGLGVTVDEQRQQFNAWVAYLQAGPTERTRRDGSATLYAKFEWGDEPAGAIRAELVPPMDDGDAA